MFSDARHLDLTQAKGEDADKGGEDKADEVKEKMMQLMPEIEYKRMDQGKASPNNLHQGRGCVW